MKNVQGRRNHARKVTPKAIQYQSLKGFIFDLKSTQQYDNAIDQGPLFLSFTKILLLLKGKRKPLLRARTRLIR
jgi:hypothetical protein